MDLKVDANLTNVAENIYSDGAKEILIETSKIGLDAVKTLRLALAPLQYTALLQDRLSSYFQRAFKKVPEENRIPPMPSLALPIMERLRYQDDGDLLTDLYIDLLATAFDKTKIGESHPAFITLITQISPDEAILLDLLSNSELKIYFGKEPLEWAQSSEGIINHFSKDRLEQENIDWSYIINPDKLARPKYLQTYIGHMVSLGIIEYTNEYPMPTGPILGPIRSEKQHWALKISRFGSLFHRACIGDSTKRHLRVSKEDRL